MFNIAIIGTGPTGIYTAKYLLENQRAISVVMFESQDEAGKGTPYHQDWNSDEMLSNIASIEIPPVAETLVDWLKGQDDYQLSRLGIDEIDERKFYPRVVLGEYFHAQLEKLKIKHKALKIFVKSHVDDVEVADNEIKLTVRSKGETINPAFDYVIMATGHVWPKETEIRPGYFISPWPPTALQTIGECNVGILGTSLSAIDAMVALSTARGTFWRDAYGVLQYFAEPGTENFKVTLMSRKGLLPEADFYHEIPYLPREIFTAEKVDELIEQHRDNKLLDAVFELFKVQLTADDQEYAARIGLKDLSLEELGEAYFRERDEHDPFEWAQINLDEAKANQEKQYTVQWRYSILCMHEVIARIVPHLTAEDHQRFNHYFKSIFVDDYATVPHESIERILALHRAGKLAILKIGADYEIDKEGAETGVILSYDGKEIHFPAFIEAIGQRGLKARDFQFPSLWKQGVIQNAVVEFDNSKKKPLQIGGIALDMAFHPVSDSQEAFRLYCPSIPFMLGQFPFAQGITSSHEIGKIIADNLSQSLLQDLKASA